MQNTKYFTNIKQCNMYTNVPNLENPFKEKLIIHVDTIAERKTMFFFSCPAHC